jgi:hypothetical protein
MGVSRHSGVSSGLLKLHSKLQLQDSGSQNRAARIEAPEQVDVCRPTIPLGVRVKRGRIQVKGSVKDVPVKRIDRRCPQEKIHPLAHMCSFGQVEILTVEFRVTHIANSSGHSPKLIAVATESASVVGIGECLAVKHRISHGVEVTTQVLLAKDLLPFNLIIAKGSSKRGRSRSATERERLPTLIPLNSADLPASDQLVNDTSLIDEALSFANGQVVDVAQNKGLGDVLVTDGFLAFRIKRILRTASSVQRGKEWKCRVGIGESLRPSVGGHQAQTISEPAAKRSLKGVIGGLP